MSEHNDTIACPVDLVTINENQARITALFVFILTVTYILTGYWLIIAFLAVDFSLRAANQGKFSVLGRVSGITVSLLGIGNKPTDRAPKRFAAAVGLLFTAAITVFHLLEVAFAPYIVADILAIFAFLEAAFAFCAGCHVYTLVRPLLPAKS